MTREISKTPHLYPRNSSKVRPGTPCFSVRKTLSWKMNSCLIHNFCADRYFDITLEILFCSCCSSSTFWTERKSALKGRSHKNHHIKDCYLCFIVTFYSCIKLHYELKNLLSVSSISPLFNFDVIIFKFCETEINHAIQTAVFELWHVHAKVFSENSVINSVKSTLFP